ncbi:MAG: hypothetical protein ACREO4_16345 [Lysobacter sp.]
MAFDLATYMGEPVHLFIWRRQGVTLRYASGMRDVTIDGHTYVAAQIDRDAIRQTTEKAKDRLKIRIAYLLDPAAPEYPITQELGNWWRPHIPSDDVSVVCLSHQYGSLDPPSVEWMGTVASPVYGDAQLEITCDPNTGRSDAANQGPKAQRACFKTVYSTGPRGCNLDEDDFKIPGTLTAVDGLTLTAPELIGTEFTLQGGTLYWTRGDGIVEERPIMAHDNSTGVVHILWGGQDLAEDLDIVAVPNCPGTWAACAARRPDPENWYGGSVYKPVRDPILDGVSMSWG